jgi:hypothetical protein
MSHEYADSKAAAEGRNEERKATSAMGTMQNCGPLFKAEAMTAHSFPVANSNISTSKASAGDGTMSLDFTEN